MIFYSDEDQIDEAGLRSDPFFKPDWSPDLILAENYVNHLMICRRTLALEVGGFRGIFDLSQDHDILLRMSVKARRIVHIPRILYHWRTGAPSMQRASQWEHRAVDSSRRVIVDHLAATGIRATVEPGEIPVRWRVRYAIPDDQRVQILVPSARVELLEPCLRSIAQRTDYRDYEIAVLDNSHNKGIEHFVQRWKTKVRPLKYLDFRHRPFNYSALNNAAARETDAPLLLFLNDDITVITPGWLTAMVELASRREVGAVGAKLLYPDGTLQHSGVVMGLFDICGHAFKGSLDEERQYFDFPNVIRNVSAVTGACMMVPAKRFWECGGFDEEALPIAYQDVDLCLKLGQRGYRVLVTPHARLYHHEASSKRPEDKDPTPSEALTIQARWKAVIEQDPFYSPNLTRYEEDYSYRKKS
jgi:GT2 family glycosyltransferase